MKAHEMCAAEQCHHISSHKLRTDAGHDLLPGFTAKLPVIGSANTTGADVRRKSLNSLTALTHFVCFCCV